MEVRPELPAERDHGIADGVMLLSTLCVAVVTWNYLPRISALPMWKFYCGVGVTFVLALASLTRRARWADTFKFLMGIWTIIVPFALGLTEAEAALWIYLTTGILLAALPISGFIRQTRTYLSGNGAAKACWLVPLLSQRRGAAERPTRPGRCPEGGMGKLLSRVKVAGHCASDLRNGRALRFTP
jgi:hypothetical protein